MYMYMTVHVQFYCIRVVHHQNEMCKLKPEMDNCYKNITHQQQYILPAVYAQCTTHYTHDESVEFKNAYTWKHTAVAHLYVWTLWDRINVS